MATFPFFNHRPLGQICAGCGAAMAYPNQQPRFHGLCSPCRKSSDVFDIAAEHASWCKSRRQTPEEVLASIGIKLDGWEPAPSWTRVIEELARHFAATRRW
jgi:hypothetical protein